MAAYWRSCVEMCCLIRDPQGLQIACYGCLDVLTKVVFGYILMSSYGVIDRVTDTELSE